MGNKRILIVDDDQEFSEGMATRCRHLGLEVETARNSLTALTIIGVRPPDLICMDVEMPTGNGLSICELLTADPAVAKKPVIVLTGRSDDGTRQRCMELRAHYMQKSPDVWRRLKPVVCDLLDYQPEPAGQTPASAAESP